MRFANDDNGDDENDDDDVDDDDDDNLHSVWQLFIFGCWQSLNYGHKYYEQINQFYKTVINVVSYF